MSKPKIDAGRIVLLVLLLAVLIGTTLSMLKNTGVIGRPRTPATTAGTPPAAGQAAKSDTATYDPTKTASATNMAPVAGSKGPQPTGATSVSTSVNDNLFKVFGLNPARNPFVKREEWYSEDLAQIPGYPEMRDSGYFDSMEDTVPLEVLEDLPGDHEWTSVQVEKSHLTNAYSIAATSQDGRISTTIKAETATPEPVSFIWTGDSGIPLNELSVPGWDERFDLPAAGAGGGVVPAEDAEAGAEIPELEDASNDSGVGTMPMPGPHGAGDQLFCQGINIAEGRKSALVGFNGQRFIVMEGTVLPTHYQVLSINEDGIVLLELRDGSSRFLPLQSPPAPSPTR